MLQFPFWIAVPRETLSPQGSKGYGTGAPWTFSTAEKMAKFLAAHHNVQCETKLVDRYSAPAVISKLATDGFSAVCHDADEDGSGATDISLAEISAALHR